MSFEFHRTIGLRLEDIKTMRQLLEEHDRKNPWTIWIHRPENNIVILRWDDAPSVFYWPDVTPFDEFHYVNQNGIAEYFKQDVKYALFQLDKQTKVAHYR